MKTVKFFLAVMLVMIGTSASAQFTSSPRSHASSKNVNSGWNEFTFDLGYGQTYYTGDHDIDSEDIWGVSFNYGRGIHLNRSNGLTLRPGTGVLVAYQNTDGHYDDVNTVVVSITPKVDFGYHFTFPNSSVSLFPYVGLTTRVNVWGQIDYNDETYDLFDSDEGDANRFQVGGRIGFDAHFNHFVLGFTYEQDFTKFSEYNYRGFSEDIKIRDINLRLGWCF